MLRSAIVLVAVLAADARGPALSAERMTNEREGVAFIGALWRNLIGSWPALPVISAQNGDQRPEELPDAFQGMMAPGLASNNDCIPPEQIRRHLKLQGWWDFDRLEREGDKFQLRARRPNGTAYQLTIDGCSGRVLGAMRLNDENRGYRLWPR